MPWFVGVAGDRLLTLAIAHDEAVLVAVLAYPLAHRSVGEAGLQTAGTVGIADVDGQTGLMLTGSRDRRDARGVALAVNAGVVVEQFGLAVIRTVAAHCTDLHAILGSGLGHLVVGFRRRRAKPYVGALDRYRLGSILLGTQRVLLVDEDIILRRVALDLLGSDLN